MFNRMSSNCFMSVTRTALLVMTTLTLLAGCSSLNEGRDHEIIDGLDSPDVIVLRVQVIEQEYTGYRPKYDCEEKDSPCIVFAL